MTKFKSQALHIIRIKYWKSSGSGNPPSLRKIAIYVILCTILDTIVSDWVASIIIKVS